MTSRDDRLSYRQLGFLSSHLTLILFTAFSEMRYVITANVVYYESVVAKILRPRLDPRSSSPLHHSKASESIRNVPVY